MKFDIPACNDMSLQGRSSLLLPVEQDKNLSSIFSHFPLGSFIFLKSSSFSSSFWTSAHPFGKALTTPLRVLQTHCPGNKIFGREFLLLVLVLLKKKKTRTIMKKLIICQSKKKTNKQKQRQKNTKQKPEVWVCCTSFVIN